jgi:small subunit ribosomal protein S7
MPRRAAAATRPVEADPVHRSKLVTQVINRVMLDGKKSTAERIVYDALAILSERTGKDPVEALREKSMAQRLANELLDAQSQQGGAYKRKDDIFRMAQANKAFAHYRW